MAGDQRLKSSPGGGESVIASSAGLNRREQVLERVVEIMIEHPLEGLGLQAVANLTGVSIWSLRYHFDSVENLFRTAVVSLVDKINSASAAFSMPSECAVFEGIHRYAQFLRSLVAQPEYGKLVLLVLRSGRRDHWLRELYERRVLRVLCRGLENGVLETGLHRGAAVAFRDGAPMRLIHKIEAEFVFPSLLWREFATTADDEEFVRQVAQQAFEATYVFDWQAAPAA